MDLSTSAIAGATDLDADMLKQNTAAALAADRAAMLTARTELDVARQELDRRRVVLRDERAAVRDFVIAARDRLKRKLGNHHSGFWDETGFVGSLEMPRSIGGLKILVERLSGYYRDHPELESVEQDLNSVRAANLFKSLCAAENAVASQVSAVGTLQKRRDEKFLQLKRRLRGLVKELEDLIGPNDPRWLSFGLNLPGAHQTPDVPEEVTVELVQPDAAAVKWKRAPRAEYYHVFMKVEGVDEDFVRIGSPIDPSFIIRSLPANATVHIAISALNDGGESRLSTVVEVCEKVLPTSCRQN